jgi:hypothetical protein
MFERWSKHRPLLSTPLPTPCCNWPCDNAIDQDEATELLNWDLGTIAEFLALRLQQHGFLSPQEVTDILETHTSAQYH